MTNLRWTACALALGAACAPELPQLRAPVQQEVWSHRGVAGPGHEQNSPAAVAAARRAGFAGVEIDVRWMDGALWAAHDAEAPRWPLASVLSELGPMSVWIDFKALSPEVAVQAAPVLAAHVAPLERVLLESGDPDALTVIARACPGVTPVWRPAWWQRVRWLPMYSGVLERVRDEGVPAVAWSQRELTRRAVADLAPARVVAYTARTEAEVRRALAAGAWIVLTDVARPP